MTKTQKEVLQVSLDDEKAVIRKLKQVYKQAAKDCEAKIAALNARTDLQNLQTIIYQRQYQEALKGQLDAVLSTLQSNEYGAVSEYLSGCYETGYIGTMYDLAEQGIPIVSPIDQAQAAAAIQTDTQLKANLYESMGEDVDKLKSSISSELSRGIANGSSWLEVAAQVASGMNSPFNKALNRTTLIARTEGHRIQNQAALNAAETARNNGADVVKQWDATLDDRTRPDHRAADGQIRELNEEFDVGGEKMKAPGIGGSAKQVCNCRCALLQRARWALDEDELDRLKARAEYYGLSKDKTKDFEEFKKKYLQAAKDADTMSLSSGSAVQSSNSKTSASTGSTIPMNLQFFAEKGLQSQSSTSLKKGIASLKKQVAEHKAKIANPESIYPNWSGLTEREQKGLMNHWKVEISNFEESIANREAELKERGDL